MSKIERALISVYDKSGVVEFASGLHQLGVELLSTGGTASALREADLPVIDLSEFTGFPEMLDGRVKTLHPKVHAGLLHLRDDPTHQATMTEHDLVPIDLVCVNLYPFEETIAREGVTFEEAVEQIDIGGPTMLRSAAKNMRYVTVVSSPDDYGRVLDAIRAGDGQTDKALRIELAQQVFARVAGYNSAIANYLAEQQQGGTRPLVLSYPDSIDLRYGENPHQYARLYLEANPREACIAHTEQLHGKSMSYNNYVDGEAALEAVKELAGQPGASIIKHTNPCGFATGPTLEAALEAAWEGDPVSAFGSVIAVTEPVTVAAAAVLKGRFVEALIAPAFEPDALEYLQKKSKDLRLLKLCEPMATAAPGLHLRQVNGGLLVQGRDVGAEEQWNVPTSAFFPEDMLDLANFGIRACKHVKSNAILLVRAYADGAYQVLGMGAGQPNRVDAVRKLALTKARENIQLLYKKANYGVSPNEFESGILKECVLISDAFFPFPDNIHNAAEAGIRYIVEPGGSKRDEEVVSTCDQYGIAMAFTGVRHFRH